MKNAKQRWQLWAAPVLLPAPAGGREGTTDSDHVFLALLEMPGMFAQREEAIVTTQDENQQHKFPKMTIMCCG